ncbi:hypothetical protein KAR91_18165 [Candidatus Pacearchaeota archaeon]|nr:hypothetical protein [Candidatus Pacearchaeota archaeon]
MPSFEFTSPEGKKYQVGAPEGATQAQAFEMLQKQLGAQPTEQPSIQQPQPVPPAQQPEQQGFLSRVGTGLKERVGEAEKIKTAHRAGEQTLPESIVQGVGKVGAGIMLDIAGEAATSAYRALPKKARDTIEDNKALQFGISMAQKGADVYGKWAEQNPRIARNLEGVANIAAFFPAPTGRALGKVATSTAKGVGEATAVRPLAKGVMAPSTKKMESITDNIHKQATATIEQVKESGIQYSPEHAIKTVDDLDSIKQLTTAGERAGAVQTVSTLDNMKDSVLGPPAKDKKGKIVRDVDGNPVRDATKADTSVRNLLGWSDAFRKLSRSESAALSAKSIIDDAISDTASIVAGHVEDAALVPVFKKEWARYKMGEKVMDAAGLAKESSAKSRRAFQKIVKSKYFGGLSPEIQRLSKNAASGKAAGRFMDAIGSISRLMGGRLAQGALVMGAGVAGGPVGAGLALGGVVGAKQGGRLIQRGTAADVLKAIRDNK